MAISRARTVKPRFFEDEDLLMLPVEVRMTFLGLMAHADDFGCESANPMLLKTSFWKLDWAVTPQTIEGHLVALDDAGFVQLYDSSDRIYYSIVDWPSWQRVDKPTASKIPPPPSLESLANLSRMTRETLAVEGRGARAGAGGRVEVVGVGDARELLGSPPLPYCSQHPGGTEIPCWPCRTARRKHESYMRDMLDSEALADELDPDAM